MMEMDRRNAAFSAEPMAGERHQQHEGRRAHRWGKEYGYPTPRVECVGCSRTMIPEGLL